MAGIQPYTYPENTYMPGDSRAANLAPTYRYPVSNMATSIRQHFWHPEPVCGPQAANNMAIPGQQYSTGPMNYFYPRLEIGTTEPILITQVLAPYCFSCQLRSMSHEAQRLSDSMQHYYQVQKGYGELGPQPALTAGQPCASLGADGRWYRSLLQGLFVDKPLATVIHVDWGGREIVPLSRLRHLAEEFLRLPVVTFPCALYNIANGGLDWDQRLVAEFCTLLHGKQVNAKIECFNSYERLYFVTLFAEDGTDLNQHFKTRSQNPTVTMPGLTDPLADDEKKLPSEQTLQSSSYVSKFPPVELKTSKFYDAEVVFVIDPFNFWVRLKMYAAEHKEMVEGMTTLYSQASKLEGIIATPKPGQLCCARYEDLYCRAEVISLDEKKHVKVYFLDDGILETVDWYNVKELPTKFSKLQALAVKCCIADTYPLEDAWSQEAIRAFKIVVTDRHLVIHVILKDADEYTIDIQDQSRIDERCVGKILANAGLARFEELDSVDGQSNSEKIGIIEPAKAVLRPSAADYIPKIEEKTTASYTSEENTETLQFSPFEDQLFEPGTTIEVVVSYIENPGLFWCQNARSRADLCTLMDAIQKQCMSTNCLYTSDTLACLAKSPKDDIWYRAFINEIPVNISKTTTVEVLYVDYGIRETVPLTNLRALNSDFFHLKAQAFKCSLYNIITPKGNNPFTWDTEATKVFSQFVQKASKWTEFHCIFYATASLDKEIFNIVDLYTPFASVCDELVQSGYATHLHHKTLAPSVQLLSYYYSKHDLKLGDKEEIFITYVDSPSLFYLQLARSGNTIDRISATITKVMDKTPKKLLSNCGSLCLAKFSDQQWYRGLKSENESNKIFFVDYGNTEKLSKDDILPIMSSEHNILLVPVQAIKCSLSDIPSVVPGKIVSWFKNTVLDKPLKALFVAKDADGKFSIDLFDGEQKINETLKSKLGLRILKEKNDYPPPTCPRSAKQEDSRKPDNASNQERKISFTVETSFKSRNFEVRSQSLTRDSDVRSHTVTRDSDSRSHSVTRGPDSRNHSVYRDSDSRSHSITRGSDNRSHLLMAQEPERIYKKNPAFPYKAESKDYNSHFQESSFQRKTETNQRFGCQGNFGGRDVKQGGKSFPQRPSSMLATERPSAKPPVAVTLSDFPQRKIFCGMKEAVYVSHTNSVFDFYVQVAEDSKLDEISEILNNNKSSLEELRNEDVHPGNVICAYFSDDGLYYRGVVTAKSRQGLCVQYIDYGNTSVISDCKNYSLPQKCRSVPVMSIYCSLEKPKNASSAPNLQEVLTKFSERTNDVHLNCEFRKQDGRKWEVILKDELGCLNDLLNAPEEPVKEEKIKGAKEKIMKVVPEVKAPSVSAFNWNLPQPGATVKVYASAVDGPECFWCQLSTADIDSLASQVQEAGEKSVGSNDFITSLRVGSPCNVIFSEDNNWYRAMVTKMESDDVTVRFIDYGNEDSVGQDQIRKLPEPLVKIPPQAFSCCLADFDMKAETWTSEGRNYFYEKVNEDVLELTIDEIQERDESHIPVACVTIKCNGLDIHENVRQFLQGVKSEGLEVPDGSLSPIDENQAVETDQPQACEGLLSTDVRASEPEESALEGQYDEDCPLQEDVMEDNTCSRLDEEQERDTDGVKEAENLHHKAHNDLAVEDLRQVPLKDQVLQDEFEATAGNKITIVPGGSEDFAEFEEFEDCTEGPYEENNDIIDDVSFNPPEQGGLMAPGHPETAAYQQCPDPMSSRHQDAGESLSASRGWRMIAADVWSDIHRDLSLAAATTTPNIEYTLLHDERLSRDTSASLESLISHFNDKLCLLNEEKTSHDSAEKEDTTESEEAIVREAESAEEFEDCTEDETEQEKENEGIDVPSGDYVEIEDALRGEALETSLESDDLDKAEGPLPSIISQEDKEIITIKVADEPVPSVISEDVHKVENIVKNEDVAVTDAMLAIEGNEVYGEAMAREDVLDDNTVDNVVSAELLYIEPEKDEDNKEVGKYGGLVISEDDLVPGDAKILLESKAMTEGEEVSEDCADIEAICAEDLSLKEETVTEDTTEGEEAIVREAESAEEFEDCTEDGTRQENEGIDVPSEYYVDIEDALRGEALETSLESDDLHTDGGPAPSIISQEDKEIITIKVADELVPSVISEDVRKIENIVKNEDVAATGAMLAIEGNEVYDEAMASEDVLEDNTVDNVVSAELLYIEPEKDEDNKEVGKYGGLVISEDDLVPGDAKMLLESKAMTEGEEVSEDCADIEATCAEDLSLKEETVTDQTMQEKLEHEGIDVPSGDYVDIEDSLRGEALETSLESDDLGKAEGPLPSIMSQEDKKIITIKVADELVPSAINEDVHKIENIVKNEDVAVTDAMLAIGGNEVYDEAMASEDVLEDNNVDNVVSAELLYIEPEKDEDNKEVGKYGGLVIREDDLVPGDAKMLLESKAMTEGEEVREDCADIEATCAEDLSLKEETVTDETMQEKLEHEGIDVPGEDYVEIEDSLRGEALETSLECDDLHTDGGPAPSIMSQEDKIILTIKVADELVPSVISEDVRKIENIVKNEDVAATDSMLAIEGNEVYDEAMASEDVLEDNTVDNVVSADLLYIEPEKDEDNKEVGKYGGLVISEDDLVPGDAKMLLESKAMTEGEEVSEDCADIEATCAEDLSLKEETVTDGTKQEKLEHECLDVPSGDYVDIEDSLRGEALETSLESDDLHRDGGPAPSIMSQEDKEILTIKVADELVPSVISEDVHKIENIVKNEDVAATDSMLAIEGNEVYGEAMASEDVLEDNTVDNVVSAELLYIEPEKDEDNKEVGKYGGLVTREDDLVPGDAKMLLESKAMTEGEEVSEDCADIEATCAEDLSLKEETVTDETMQEKLEHEDDVPGEDYVDIEDALRGEALETSFESDDLHTDGGPAPSIMSQEDREIITIKVADELVPSVISEDVRKIENIVNNEDVAATDAMLAIEGNEVYDEAMASEDVLEDNNVDNVVSAELLYIEPEKGEANKEVGKYGELVISEDDLVPENKEEGDKEDVGCEDVKEALASQEVLCGFLSADFINLKEEPEIIQGYVETVKVDSSQHVEPLGSVTSNDFVESTGDYTESNITECGAVTTTDIAEIIQNDEELVSTERAVKEISLSFEEVEATVVEGPLVDVIQEFHAGEGEEPVENKDLEFKDTMKSEVVVEEEVEIGASAFEENFWESQCTGDISDHELVEDFTESSRHSVDCVRGICDPSEDTLPADDSSTTLPEEQEHAPAEVMAEDLWEPTSEDVTLEGQGSHSGSFTTYRESPTLIASTESELSDPLEETDSDSEAPDTVETELSPYRGGKYSSQSP